MAHGGSAVAHGGAWPRSGMTGLAWSVMSSQELLHEMGKTRRGLGEEEWCGGALATVSAISGDAQPWRWWWKRSQRPYLSLSGSAKRWRTERRTRRSSRRAGRRVFAVVRELGDGEAGAAMAEWLLAWHNARWRRRKANWSGLVRRQARGGFKTRLRRQNAHGTWPARSAGRRRAAYTRPPSSESPEHCSV